MLESSVLVVSMSNGVVESLFESSKLASSELHFFIKVRKEGNLEVPFFQEAFEEHYI